MHAVEDLRKQVTKEEVEHTIKVLKEADKPKKPKVKKEKTAAVPA